MEKIIWDEKNSLKELTLKENKALKEQNIIFIKKRHDEREKTK